MPMLKIELKPGQSLAIGDAIVTLEEKSGQVARLAVQADKSIPVHRIQSGSSVAQVAAQGLAKSA